MGTNPLIQVTCSGGSNKEDWEYKDSSLWEDMILLFAVFFFFFQLVGKADLHSGKITVNKYALTNRL